MNSEHSVSGEFDPKTAALTWGASKAEVERVFTLGGGELGVGDRLNSAWHRRAYWYDGAPDYAQTDCEAAAMSALGCEWGEVELVTALECRIFGKIDCPEGWVEVAFYLSSGESVDDDAEEWGGERIVYIGDGWGEAVYARKYPTQD